MSKETSVFYRLDNRDPNENSSSVTISAITEGYDKPWSLEEFSLWMGEDTEKILSVSQNDPVTIYKNGHQGWGIYHRGVCAFDNLDELYKFAKTTNTKNTFFERKYLYTIEGKYLGRGFTDECIIKPIRIISKENFDLETILNLIKQKGEN